MEAEAMAMLRLIARISSEVTENDLLCRRSPAVYFCVVESLSDSNFLRLK